MYIICKFTSSKVAFNTKDYVAEYDTKTMKVESEKREQLADPSNLISFSQISNVLHVLMGVRPAPVNRKTFHKRSNFIDDLANNSWVKITNKYSYVNKDDKECYYYEFTQGKKSPWNSNVKGVTNCITDNTPITKGFLTWSSLKKKYYFLEREKYDDVIKTFEKITGSSYNELKKKYTLIELITDLASKPDTKKELDKLGERIKYSGLSNLKTYESFNSAGSMSNLAILTINTSTTYKISLDGEIVFEINDDDVIDTLFSGNRMATFLDGGMVEIIDITDDFINDGYKLITKN